MELIFLENLRFEIKLDFTEIIGLICNWISPSLISIPSDSLNILLIRISDLSAKKLNFVFSKKISFVTCNFKSETFPLAIKSLIELFSLKKISKLEIIFPFFYFIIDNAFKIRRFNNYN